MLFNDFWIKDINVRQQNLVIEYLQNACQVFSGIGGYKNIQYVKSFLNSKKGRTAVRRYSEYLFDLKKDTVKLQLLKIYMIRTFYNPADILTADGELLPEYNDDLKNLNDLAYCIEGIEKTATGVRGNLKIKLCDRDKAREVIEKLFNIYDREDVDDNTGDISVFEMTDEERDLEIKYLIEKDKGVEK